MSKKKRTEPVEPARLTKEPQAVHAAEAARIAQAAHESGEDDG